MRRGEEELQGDVQVVRVSNPNPNPNPNPDPNPNPNPNPTRCGVAENLVKPGAPAIWQKEEVPKPKCKRFATQGSNPRTGRPLPRTGRRDGARHSPVSLASDSMSPSVMDFWCDAQCAIDAAGKCPTNVCKGLGLGLGIGLA